MRATPRMLTVIVPNSTPVNLLTLLQAIDSQTEDHCQALQLQQDPASMSDVVSIGNSDLNPSTRWGVKLQAGQPTQFVSMSSNLYVLSQIYLATTGTNTSVGVMIVTR